jgi:hypothetical protein
VKIRTLPPLTEEEKHNIKIRILTKVNISPKGCWEFFGCRTNCGYGGIEVKRKSYLCHRVTFYLWKENPSEMCVLHKCDNPSCCNPHHLFLGSQMDNVWDMKKKDRGNDLNKGQKGEIHHHSKFTGDKIKEIRKKYTPRIYTMKMLANDYEVNKNTIWKIINRKSWKHLKD